ncbi:MAG: acetate kinase, partial [bacterium]|nr:acetate kinase [bacterium]
IRNRICEGLGGLGITLDQEKNNRMVSVDALINSEHSPVKIAVITTDEPGQMAKETMELLHK